MIMAQKFKKIGILTSGGDAPGMNAAVRAVTLRALEEGIEVCGIRSGYYGLLHEKWETMTPNSVAGLTAQSGTVLPTAEIFPAAGCIFIFVHRLSFPFFKSRSVKQKKVLRFRSTFEKPSVQLIPTRSFRGACR